MKNKTKRGMRLVTGTAGILLGVGGSCLPEDFWITQIDLALTTAFETVAANTLIPAIDEALGADGE